MDDYPTPTYIRNHQAVLHAYGYWPSFHDAPLVEFRHDPESSTARLVIAVSEMTEDTDERGFFGHTKRHLVQFQFVGVTDLTVQQFAIPNTLIEMTFSSASEFDAEGRFRVELVSVVGGDCTLTFVATSGEVVAVDAQTNR